MKTKMATKVILCCSINQTADSINKMADGNNLHSIHNSHFKLQYYYKYKLPEIWNYYSKSLRIFWNIQTHFNVILLLMFIYQLRSYLIIIA